MPAYLVELPNVTGLTLPEGANKFVVFAADAANARAAAKGHFDGDANAVFDSAATVTEIVAGSALSGVNLDITIFGGGAQTGPLKVSAAGTERKHIGGIAINAGGSGHAQDDILTFTGGTFTRAATARVITVSTGVITAIEIVDPGDYTVLPTLTAVASTSSGAGTGQTMDLTQALAGSYEALMGEIVTTLNASADIAAAAVDMSEGASGTRLLTLAAAGDGIGDATVVLAFNKNGTAQPSLAGTVTDEGVAGAALTMAIPASPIAIANVVAAVKG